MGVEKLDYVNDEIWSLLPDETQDFVGDVGQDYENDEIHGDEAWDYVNDDINDYVDDKEQDYKNDEKQDSVGEAWHYDGGEI